MYCWSRSPVSANADQYLSEYDAYNRWWAAIQDDGIPRYGGHWQGNTINNWNGHTNDFGVSPFCAI
jgi:hypothetical protein